MHSTMWVDTEATMERKAAGHKRTHPAWLHSREAPRGVIALETAGRRYAPGQGEGWGPGV